MARTARSPRAHIRRGDVVKAIAGESATGKTGKVLQVFPRREAAIVEGFNRVKKHMKPTQDNPQGGIVEIEAPMAISNLRKVEGAADKGRSKRATGAK